MLAVGADDSLEDLTAFRDELGLTLPVLFDEDGSVQASYELDPAYVDTVYPQDYLLDPEGTIVYLATTYEPERIRSLVDEMLSP